MEEERERVEIVKTIGDIGEDGIEGLRSGKKRWGERGIDVSVMIFHIRNDEICESPSSGSIDLLSTRILQCMSLAT